MPLAYELVAETDVTSATTQVDFTGISFDEETLLLLVSDIKNAGTACTYRLEFNTISTVDYYTQKLEASSTTKSGFRTNSSSGIISEASANDECISLADIFLTEGSRISYQSHSIKNCGQSDIALQDYCGTTTFSSTEITQISVKSSTASQIASGSNLKLYKLIAEPIADITTTSASTQVDITGLSLSKSNELLLVEDMRGTSIPASELYVNNDVTASNYYYQAVSANGTSVTGARSTGPRKTGTSNNLFALIKIKLTNSNYYNYQSSIVRDSGTTTVRLQKFYGSKTATISSITSLSIKSISANGIPSGSRFRLYKLK